MSGDSSSGDNPHPEDPMTEAHVDSAEAVEKNVQPETMADLGFLDPPQAVDELGRLGPYIILQVIGRGGMGRVFKARDPSLDRLVAVKVMSPHLASDDTSRKRFLREARSAASITHEHVVTIHNVGEANGLPYLIMQFVDGVSLQDRLKEKGALRVSEILRIGRQIAEGLTAAHDKGLIHRDIKPGNILLEAPKEKVLITDFGLARATDEASIVSQTGGLAGTPQYMSPEQARGEPVDHRADLFSLGSVLYALCTGEAPFQAPTLVAVLRRVSDEQPIPILQLNPRIPSRIVSLIKKLHAKDPAGRYQTAGEVADLLEYFAKHPTELQEDPTPLYHAVLQSEESARPKPPPLPPVTPVPIGRRIDSLDWDSADDPLPRKRRKPAKGTMIPLILAIASVTFGLLAPLFGLIPLGAVIGFPFALCGLVFGIGSLIASYLQEEQRGWLPFIGIGLNLLSGIGLFMWQIVSAIG